MTARSYTVAEIDRMRAALRRRDGVTDNSFRYSFSDAHSPAAAHLRAEVDASAARYAASVEDRLRTYMTAGTSPEDLEAHATESR